MALLAQIKRLQDTPVEAEELERIKAQVVASDVYEQDSTFYQATQIGMLEAVGLDWSVADDYVRRIKGVTASQVQAVARKYLQEKQQTIAVLDPLPMDPGRKPQPVSTGAGHVH